LAPLLPILGEGEPISKSLSQSWERDLGRGFLIYARGLIRKFMIPLHV
jgi:hypothetical protein